MLWVVAFGGFGGLDRLQAMPQGGPHLFASHQLLWLYRFGWLGGLHLIPQETFG